ncbi:uncharacterized protein PGTG_03169 [Puccinia graminis f. sp. tritici CRL 75-36-700-3]|uniref:Carboxylic ester hydrolase n=1 Tax=Puccinia graminis f. sp. tritici (strain CRL 75-36-700-3 / race SCCL) TaxID=418459 RepID=E3JYT8_PUCGT|nr:uncharacterized protein PGTG_03169 [Puccinia graminis f. sp. tritici CRL 75-36-700-3]EFP77213.2 hypothetical protein PGTG_03169 [Puccinia graminis f. sp. tritici CRL 75-36-700-3]
MTPMKLPWGSRNLKTFITLIFALNILLCLSLSSQPDSKDHHISPSSSPDTPRSQSQGVQEKKSPPFSKKPLAPKLPRPKPPAQEDQQSPPKSKTSPKQEAHLPKKKSAQLVAKQAVNHTEKTWSNHTSPTSSHPNPLSVLTTSGRYLGFTNQSRHSVDTWLGVRYAKPPIDDLRFRAPVILDKNQLDDGKLQLAFEFGDACPQPPFNPPLEPEVDISEDCLYLNVYRPSNVTHHSLLPVLVWIHGGGYTYGTGASTDGAVLVSSSFDLDKPIIFVSMNYRLGPFGFLNTEDLPVDDLQVGLKDQIACLKWLKLNIKAFGGDPRKITLWGQSAGAIAVSTLVTYLYDTPHATLFRAAIMDSGSPTSHTVPPVYVYDRAGMPYTLLVNGTGCDAPSTAEKGRRKSRKSRSTQVDRLECLRDLEYNVLLNASMTLLQTLPFSRQVTTWGPSYKAGSLIDRRPSERLIDGDFIKIPMILGTNKDEGARAAAGPSLGFHGPLEDSDTYFESYMTNTSILDFERIDKEVYKKVGELYPDEPSLGSPFDTGNNTFGLPRIFKRMAAWYGDLHYQAPKRFWAHYASPHQPVYVYYFDGPAASNDPSSGGVSHSSELPLIFGNIDEEDLPVIEIKETRALAERVRNRYISFAYELNPGDDWPAYTPRAKRVMRFNKKIVHGELIEDDWRAEQLSYLNSEAAQDTYLT